MKPGVIPCAQKACALNDPENSDAKLTVRTLRNGAVIITRKAGGGEPAVKALTPLWSGGKMTWEESDREPDFALPPDAPQNASEAPSGQKKS